MLCGVSFDAYEDLPLVGKQSADNRWWGMPCFCFVFVFNTTQLTKPKHSQEYFTKLKALFLLCYNSTVIATWGWLFCSSNPN